MIPKEFLPGLRAFSTLARGDKYEGFVRNEGKEKVYRTAALHSSPAKARKAAENEYKKFAVNESNS